MPFQISALPAEPFQHLFGQHDDVLAAHGVTRVMVDEGPGFPCRVSLEDAAVGESALLMNYEHQPAASPFRSSHAIFVREEAVQARPRLNEVPDLLRRRLLSVRAFDAKGMMIDADIITGTELEPVLERMLATTLVSYVHLHSAKPGCYVARVDRA